MGSTTPNSTKQFMAGLIVCLSFLPVCFSVYGIDPEDVLRDLPAPEVNYPLDEIRIKNEAQTLIQIVKPIAPPPPPTPYEIKKLAEKITESAKLPFMRSAQKIVQILTKPVAATSSHEITATGSSMLAAATSTVKLIPRPAQKALASQTKVIAAFKTLADNPNIAKIQTVIEAETAFAKDLFQLFLDGDHEEEQPEEPVKKEEQFDSIFVSAQTMRQNQKWQEIKNLFEDNQEAGETPDGLRFLIEAELYSNNPNYMAAQRFANQLRQSEPNDPLANFAIALFYYNSKKPNLDRAKQAIDLSLKSQQVPDGASALYWKIMGRKFVIPLTLLAAGLFAGIYRAVKKRKISIAINDYEGYVSTADADIELNLSSGQPERQTAIKSDSFNIKNLLAGIVSRLRKPKQQTESENTEIASSSITNITDSNQENSVEDATDNELIDEPEEDEEIHGLEGEDSKLILAKDDEDEELEESDETEEIEYEEIEIIEEIEEGEDVEYEEIEVEEEEEEKT